MKTNYLKRNFFTIIELIIVIVVLGILAAIVIPNVQNFKSTAITSMMEGNIRNIQTASDTYSLKNHGEQATEIPSTIKVPQIVSYEKFYPDYLKNMPDTRKVKNQRYWIDMNGKVWGSTVESPNNIYETNSILEWSHNEKVEKYNVYEIQGDALKGTVNKKRLNKVASIEVNGRTDKIQVAKGPNAYLVSSVDEYGMESAPSGVNPYYYEDWFTPLLNKEGSFEFEITSDELMYWLSYRSVESKPEGTSIEYEFSVQDSKGEYGFYKTEFNDLAPSKSMKVKITMKGANGKNPSLYSFRVFYEYEKENVLMEKIRIKKENINEEGKVINPSLPVKVIDEYTLPSDKKVTDVILTDSYSPINLPNTNYYYKDNSDNWIPFPSISDVPMGSSIRIEREYVKGEDLFISSPIIKIGSEIKSKVVQPENTQSTDSILNDPEWTTVQKQNFFAHSGDGERTKWIRIEPDEVKSEGTRLLYRFSTSNSTYSWTKEIEDISKLNISRSIKVSVYYQVKTELVGKIAEPEIKGVRIFHERGYSDLSLVSPTATIIPVKNNNSTTDYFSNETKIEWTYETFDPRGKEIVDVEWSGDKRDQYPVGVYQVNLRVKNSSNYWSDWTSFKFEVKEEKPVAIIGFSPDYIMANKKVEWNYNSSIDPDKDGIAKAEWKGDKKDLYDKTGEYIVYLRVQDTEGNWSDWVEKKITVNNEAFLIYRMEAENTGISQNHYYSHNEASRGIYVRNITPTGGNTSAYNVEFIGTSVVIRYLGLGKEMTFRLDGSLYKVPTKNTGLFETYTLSGLEFKKHLISVDRYNETPIDYFDVYSPEDTPTISNISSRVITEGGIELPTNSQTFNVNSNEKLKISYSLDKNSSILEQIKDSEGKLVRTLRNNSNLVGDTGYNLYGTVWEGRDNNGGIVKEGNYILEITAKGVGGSTTSITYPIQLVNKEPIYRMEAEKISTLNSGFIVSNETASRGSYARNINPNGGSSTSYSFVFTGNAFDLTYLSLGEKLEFRLDGSLYSIPTQNTGKFETYTLSNLSLGSHTVTFGTTNRTGVDYLDVYSSDDTVSISNYKAQAIPESGYEHNFLNNQFNIASGERMKIYYTIDKNSFVNEVVKDSSGNVVRNFRTNQNLTGDTTFNTYSIVWDGKDNNGNIVNTGNYTLEITAKGIKGSVTKITNPIELLNKEPIRRIEGETGSTNSIFKYSRADASGGQYIKNIGAGGNTTSLSYKFTGNSFDIRYLGNGSDFSFRINGLMYTFKTVNTGKFETLSIKGLNYQEHTIAFTTSNQIGIDYFDVYQ